MTKEVAKKDSTAISTAISYENEGGAGFENADQAAYAIPFIAILQSGSPQCKKSEGAYIAGAEEGDLYDTVSEKIVKGEDGLEIVPCHYKRSFIEWAPRDSGGGFIAEHSADDGIDLLKQTHRNDKGQDVLPNGNYLVDTRSHYVLTNIGDDIYEPAVITMSSTQIKKSRRWMTMMQNLKLRRADGSSFTPPMYSHKYTMTTVPESNDKGSWFGWKVTKGDLITDPSLHQQAKDFRAAILSGEAKEQPPANIHQPGEEEF